MMVGNVLLDLLRNLMFSWLLHRLRHTNEVEMKDLNKSLLRIDKKFVQEKYLPSAAVR